MTSRTTTPTAERRHGMVLAAALVSLLVHLAAAGGLFVVGSGPEARIIRLSDSADRSTPPVSRPGIAQSAHVTMTWLGFEQPTPHSAEASVVDQAEMSRTSEPAQPTSDPIQPARNAETVGESISEPSTDLAASGQPEPALETLVPGAESLADSAIAGLEHEAIDAAATVVPAVRPNSDSLAQWARLAADLADALSDSLGHPAPPSAGQPATDQATPPGVVATPGSATSAESSDKDAPATSIDQIIDVRPGRPAAAAGIDIRTVRPAWRVYTRLTASPTNPVVRVEFDHTGAVVAAEFHDGSSTGYADVDGPLLDAVHRWTATGPAIDRLPAGPPGDRLVLTIRVLLR